MTEDVLKIMVQLVGDDAVRTLAAGAPSQLAELVSEAARAAPMTWSDECLCRYVAPDIFDF